MFFQISTITAKNILGTKRATIICFIIALLIKVLLFLHFFWFEDDKLFQGVAAYNLAQGKGLVYNDVQTSNLHEVINVPLNRWPMGYSLCIFILYKVTGNIIAATLLFDLIFIFLFLLVLKKILQELEFPAYLINILTLFNGFSIAVYVGQPTDLQAATLILISVYYTIRFYRSESNPVGSGILIGVLSFLPSFFRYMYIPSSIITASLLLFSGMVKSDKRLVRCSVYSLAATIFLTIGLLVFNKIYAGSSAYIMPMEKGIYVFNIFKLYPFLYGSFININFICTQLELRTRFDYSFWFNLFMYANLITCSFLLLKFSAWVSMKKIKNLSSWNLFVLISVGIVAAIILLTGYLSLTHSGYRLTLKKVGFWTFMVDGRYFTFAMIVVPVIVARYLFMTSRGALYFLKYVFLFVVVFVILNTSRFLMKNLNGISSITNSTLPSELKKYLTERIEHFKEKKLDVVLTGNSESVALWGFLAGAKGLADADGIITNVPKIDSATVLLLVIKEEEKPTYDSFLIQSGSRIDSTIGKFTVYSYQLQRSE